MPESDANDFNERCRKGNVQRNYDILIANRWQASSSSQGHLVPHKAPDYTSRQYAGHR